MMIVRFALAILIAVVGLPTCGAYFVSQLGLLEELPPNPGAWMLGVGLGIAFVLWRRPNWFIHTFIHETAHAVVCVLLRVKVRKFYVSDGDGGFILPERTDFIRRILILIAPYTVPMLLLPVLIIRFFVTGDHGVRLTLQFLIGLLLLHHLHGLYHNVRINLFGKDADLSRVGRPLSFVLITASHLLLFGWTLQVVYRTG